MIEYDVQQVCENGHQITDSYNSTPNERKDFCDKCGAPTITSCKHCGTPLKGDIIDRFTIDVGTEVPSHCSSCGNLFHGLINKM